MSGALDDFSGGKQISKYGVAQNPAYWWIGTVVDVRDPKKMGRVKVHITGTHSLSTDDIPPDFLPWAQVAIPTTEGGSSGIGNVVGLKPKAQVFGFFFDGSQQMPIVLGSIPKVEIPETMDAPEIAKDRDSEIGDALEDTETESGKINHPENPITSISPETPNKNPSNNIDEKIVGRSNAEKAFHYFISPHGLGLTPNQSCAIVGNFFQESGKNFGTARNPKFDIDPTAISSFKDERSIGIAQWNPAEAADNRAGQLRDYANELKLSWDSLLAQLRFTKKELIEVSYFGLAKLRKARTVEEATKVFCYKFERPNKKYAHLENRTKYARDLLDKLDSKTAQVVEKRAPVKAADRTNPDRVRDENEVIT